MPKAKDIPRKSFFDIKFDDPIETEAWYINLKPTADEEMDGVYFGPYENKENLVDNLKKWAKAYEEKCDNLYTTLGFATLDLALVVTEKIPTYSKICYCQKLDTPMVFGGCQGIEICLILKQGPIVGTNHYGIHFEPPLEKSESEAI